MDNSLLKQVLHEYDIKRTQAILDAENRKKELLQINPRLQEIENEISKNSIEASKAILLSDSKKQSKLLSELKKKYCTNKRKK